MRPIAMAAAGVALLSVAPAHAEDQEPIVRCLAATGAVAANPDKAVAQIGIMNSIYWLGRLDPALSEAELEKRLSAVAVGLTGEKLQAELKRCGAELAERGAMMQRVGKKMQERAARIDTQ